MPHGMWDLSSPTRFRTHSPYPLQWESGVLTTGLWGNSLILFLKRKRKAWWYPLLKTTNFKIGVQCDSISLSSFFFNPSSLQNSSIHFQDKLGQITSPLWNSASWSKVRLMKWGKVFEASMLVLENNKYLINKVSWRVGGCGIFRQFFPPPSSIHHWPSCSLNWFPLAKLAGWTNVLHPFHQKYGKCLWPQKALLANGCPSPHLGTSPPTS